MSTLASVEERDAPRTTPRRPCLRRRFRDQPRTYRFVEEGLTLGESVVVAANGHHRACIARWRSNHPSISDDQFLLVVDAAETLKTIYGGGYPYQRFNATIGAIVERAARGGRAVRVFGEMVALLWSDGNVGSGPGARDLLERIGIESAILSAVRLS